MKVFIQANLFATFKSALEKAQSISGDKVSQQVQVDDAEKVLKETFDGLVEKSSENKVSILLGNGAPKSKIESNMDDIKNTLLTQEEINNGSSFDIELHINEDANISSEVTEKFNSALGNNEKIGKYLDIEMFKVINNSNVKVDTLNEKIKITIEIPSELLDKAKYYIIHNHNGKIEVLTDLDSADKTITFEVDKFSIFAISYVENEEGTEIIILEGEGIAENASAPTKPTIDTVIKGDS